VSSVSAIRLFEAEPDLARYLSPEDRALAAQVRLPAIELPAGPAKVEAALRRAGAFAGLITHGMLLQSLRLGEHAGLRLVGPGDIVSRSEAPGSMLVLDTDCRATVPTRIALLGRDLLLAGRRWPWLIAGLHGRMAEQSERLTTQLMICQLPRVDDRLLAMMWLLAESWGQVTPSGTVVPIELTHSALGGLIGARRPTVTLALSELTERGAIIRQADGWLLLQPPKAPSAAAGEALGEPRPLTPAPAKWLEEPALCADRQLAEDEQARAQLRETVARLRSEHQTRRQESQARLQGAAEIRERTLATRDRLRAGRRRG
jgi:CRP/FNR family cyclic AMP-dependent transcriptional regulator